MYAHQHGNRCTQILGYGASQFVRPSQVAKELADRLDLARNDAYRIVHELEETP